MSLKSDQMSEFMLLRAHGAEDCERMFGELKNAAPSVKSKHFDQEMAARAEAGAAGFCRSRLAAPKRR